jgi:hypothetical protein
MTAEASDDVSMSAGLRGRMLQHPAQLCGRLLGELLGKPDGDLLVLDLFRMAQGQEEKSLLPRCLESRVLAELNTFQC